jgi:two-component system CheB/CheR fusion protein
MWFEQSAANVAKAIVDTIRDPLVVVDGHLRIVTASRSFYRLLKVVPGEIEGRRLFEIGARGWDSENLRTLLLRVLPLHTTVEDYEIEANWPTLGPRVMLVNARRIYQEREGNELILMAMSDITDRKRAEQALERAKESAEEANRIKSLFLAKMSHELRTPLNAVLAFSEVIKDQLFGDGTAAKYVEYATDIHTSGHLLLELIDDLLDLSKIEAGEYKVRDDVLFLREFFVDIVRVIEPLATAKRLSLVMDMADDLPRLRADKRAVKQMAFNLLSNAVKFTPEGGTITVHAFVRAENPIGLSISVEDTGIGLAPTDVAKALTPYGQIQGRWGSIQKATGKGTGLGLPIAQSLIELHGGGLAINSRVGSGTTVTLSFPQERVITTGPGQLHSTH